MPNYAMVSAKEVIARVIRATGYKLPSTYHDDLLEWLPEGIGYLQMTKSLVTKSSGDIDCPDEILVKNYCAPLPCGFITILSVEDENGVRLGSSASVRDMTSPLSDTAGITTARVSSFEVNPFQHQTSTGLPTDEAGNIPPYYLDGSDIVQVPTTSGPEYYKIQGNYIQTSFECGFIKMHYLALPTDKEGYPLIPDNQNFKQALEWHVMRRLIGAGYEHKVFTYQYCDQQFDIYANRARNEVSYPSLNDMEKAYRTNIRLVPPIGYADQFFVNI